MQLLSGDAGCRYRFSLKAPLQAANRHGGAAVSDHGLLCPNRGICWPVLRQGTEQSDESQSGQHNLNYLVHWGSLTGWILVRRKYMHRFMDLHL
jgi:hypothetical protein